MESLWRPRSLAWKEGALLRWWVVMLEVVKWASASAEKRLIVGYDE